MTSVSGVTFDFEIGGVDSTEAFYGSFGPGTLAYVADESLTGDAGSEVTSRPPPASRRERAA